MIYYMMTGSYYAGDRVSIPIWYYPAVAVFISGISAVFLTGVQALLKERLLASCTIRCMIFTISVCFAIITAITPTRVNSALEAFGSGAEPVNGSCRNNAG